MLMEPEIPGTISKIKKKKGGGGRDGFYGGDHAKGEERKIRRGLLARKGVEQ